ncbi:hypothetical protein HCN44_003119 [Aphidius gifuensis]|uniref:Uncharacterized protein n=1 Tax=Aphidius gifuensis TaxID=684658 RepID=A0A834XIC7_APHGI|nr:hypothetical protein HCN44_003119 [Aphidius gifuensis]
MIKIIFVFLMILTVYENSKALADGIEKADDFIQFLDAYKNKVNIFAKKLTQKTNSKEAQFKKLLGRLTSNKVDIIVTLTSLRSDYKLKMSNFKEYIKKVSLNSQMEIILKKMSNVVNEHFLSLGLILLQKNMDEKKIKIKSIKKSTDATYRKEKKDKELKNIYKIIMKSELLDDILESTKNIHEKELCGTQGSPQEIIYNFYFMSLSLEILALTTMMNANAIYKIIDPDNGFEEELTDSIALSKDRIKKYSSKFLSKLEKFPKNYRNCDPFDKDKHIRDVTYTEMSGLYQRVLFYSYNILKDTDCITCDKANFTEGIDAKKCYSELEKPPTPWEKNGVPKDLEKCTTPRNCAGTVSRCRALKNPEFCTLTNSPRRYQWLRDLDADIDENQFGQRDFCDGLTQTFKEELRPSGALCQYCFCTCGDESPNSTAVNTVSLMPSLSDVAKNRVVVGARIIVQNNILHPQVREAKIDKNYKIAKDGPDRWIKIDNIEDAVQDSRLYSNISRFNEFKDYIAWKENSTGFNFDEITLDHGRVVTGLKFGMSEIKEDENINRIQIEVQSSEYNHETGQLVKDSEKWHRPNSKHPKFLKTGTRVSTMTNEITIIDSNTDQWAHLEVSHDRSDAGQTTVPLFDAQTIESIDKSPFGGMGFHHRSSNDKFSGFFALTGYSIDYYQFLKETQ